MGEAVTGGLDPQIWSVPSWGHAEVSHRMQSKVSPASGADKSCGSCQGWRGEATGRGGPRDFGQGAGCEEGLVPSGCQERCEQGTNRAAGAACSLGERVPWDQEPVCAASPQAQRREFPPAP